MNEELLALQEACWTSRNDPMGGMFILKEFQWKAIDVLAAADGIERIPEFHKLADAWEVVTDE